ncbi:MAG: LexA family transcriptional regulator [Desulfovibrionales bacterium]|nr:MAG: LexA family transcriptional regulator [Desulfovibrionales bacterium]
MRENLDQVTRLIRRTTLKTPLLLCRLPAGFPSPADDFLEKCLDLNEYLVRNPPATFLVRVSGQSMKDAGIFDGDMLVVDKSLEPVSGSVVVAIVHGELTVKTLRLRSGKAYLEPANSAYKDIEVTTEMGCEVWGVVNSVIRKLV